MIRDSSMWGNSREENNAHEDSVNDKLTPTYGKREFRTKRSLTQSREAVSPCSDDSQDDLPAGSDSPDSSEIASFANEIVVGARPQARNNGVIKVAPKPKQYKKKNYGTISSQNIRRYSAAIAPNNNDVQKWSISLDDKGFPRAKSKEFRVFGPEGKLAQFDWKPEEQILVSIKQSASMWNTTLVNADTPVTEMDGTVIDPTKTMGDLKIFQVLYGTTIEQWKKDYFTTTSSNTHSTTQSESSKYLRVYLAKGQSHVYWEEDRTLASILEELCLKRCIPYEGKVARDMKGNILDVNQKLGDLKLYDIYFGAFMGEWTSAQDVQDSDIDSQLTNISIFNTMSPRPTSRNVGSSKKKAPESWETKWLNISFKEPISQVESHSITSWATKTTLSDAIANFLALRNLKIEDVEVKDEDGRKLDVNKTLGELGVYNVKIIKMSADHMSKPLFIYLPGGQFANYLFEPTKSLKEVLDNLRQKIENLQDGELKAYDVNDRLLDDSTLMANIESRSVYYGITAKEWSASRQKVKKMRGKTSARRMSTSTVRTRTPKLERANTEKIVFNNENVLKFTEPSIFKVYLPDGQVSSIKFDPEKVLSQILEKICNTRSNLDPTKLSDPTDLDGNPVNKNKTLGQLNLMEVVYGNDMVTWTIQRAQNFIQNIIREFLSQEDNLGNSEKSLRIYLPGGNIIMRDYNKNKSIRYVLDQLCATSEDLSLSTYKPINLKGEVLDIDKTLGQIGTKEICFGTDILEWIMIRQKGEQGKEKHKKPTVQERMTFLKELETKGAKDDVVATSPFKEKSKEIKLSTDRLSKSPKPKGGKKGDNRRMSSRVISNLIETMDRRSGKHDVEDAISDKSYWHIQHSEIHDFDHYDHYVKMEPKYYPNFMVPFQFLDKPRERKMIFREMDPDPPQKKDSFSVFKISNTEANDGFMEWVRRMETSMDDKKKENQEVSVTVFSSG